MKPKKQKQYKQRLPKPFTKQQLILIFTHIKNKRLKTIRINTTKLAIACFISLTTGLRASSVVKLAWNDINWERRIIEVNKAKGDKDDRVRMVKPLENVLRKWRRINKDSQWLFPSRLLKGKHILPTAIQYDLRKILKECGLEKPRYEDNIKTERGYKMYKYSFHTFRKTFGTIVYQETGDIFLTKEALNHSRIATTMIYAKSNKKQVYDKVDSVFDKPQRVAKPLVDMQELKAEIQNPLVVAQMRLAKGEIGIEEYQQLVDVLQPNLKNGENENETNNLRTRQANPKRIEPELQESYGMYNGF